MICIWIDRTAAAPAYSVIGHTGLLLAPQTNKIRAAKKIPFSRPLNQSVQILDIDVKAWMLFALPPVLILEPMPSPVLCSVLAGHKRSIELAEIYPKFIKPPIQIAGPKTFITMSILLINCSPLPLNLSHTFMHSWHFSVARRSRSDVGQWHGRSVMLH